MNVLVIGSGGREHALCHNIARSPRLSRLFVLPGNAGTAALGTNIAGDPCDIDFVLDVVRRESIDLTVVGPEDPLAAGLVDALESAGRRAFGPSAAAARIEADKAYAKQLMRRAGIPTAEARIFAPTVQEKLHRAALRQNESFDPRDIRFPTAYSQAREYVSSRDEPIVVKASGLAKGKGVFVCDSPADALLLLDRIMLEREFGDAGETVIVEERMVGREVSVMAFVDGHSLYFLEPAQDHKRLLDRDFGPNTGGMGAFCPSGSIDDDTMDVIQKQIFVPIVDAMLRDGIRYRGVLFAGLMLTGGGPSVLEFNCRFGDPETQVQLPRLRTDLLDVMEAVIDGKLDQITLDWDPRAAVCVVMASEGYPGAYEKGRTISGLPEATDDLIVFHAGTARQGDEIVNSGGRVLGVTALGRTLSDARQSAYRAAERIQFAGAQMRTDIGGAATSVSIQT